MNLPPSSTINASILSFFKGFESSIRSSVFDYELFSKFNNSVKSIDISQSTVKEYIQLMINVYQLSNFQTLFTIRKSTIIANELAFHIKILACQMICQIILYFDKQAQSAYEFPLNVLTEALQIMITTVRICLNQGSRHASKIIQFYRTINGPFQYAYDSISHESKFIHYLNVLQIKKYKIQNEVFDVQEFQNRIRHLHDFKEIQSTEYRQYAEYLTMEILLKTLKNGQFKPELIEKFQLYLSKQNYIMLKSACQFTQEKSMDCLQTEGSQFFQLYSQIKNLGIENISLDYLEQFIKKKQNFTNPSIFDIAALTLEPVVLQIWFHIHNSTKQNAQILGQAYKCFTFLLDKIHINSQNLSQAIRNNKHEQYLRLAKNVMLSLLTQKRQGKVKNTDPAFQIIKNLINLLVWLVFDLCKNFEKIKDLCQKIILLCSKFACMQICKTVYNVQLYFELLYRISSKQTYQNFFKHNQNDTSSQVYRVLKAAYDFQNNISSQLSEFNSNVLKNKSFLAILFGNQSTFLSILNLDIRQFIQIECKFSLYMQILNKFRNNPQNLSTILNHIQQMIIQLPMSDIYRQLFNSQQANEDYQQAQIKNLESLKYQIAQIHRQTSNQLNNHLNYKLSLVSIFLSFLRKQYLVIFKDINFGMVLNKFSKFIKMIYAICDKIEVCSSQIITFSKIYLVQCLQKFKTQNLKREKLGQVGQVAFIQCVSMLIKQFYSYKCQKEQNVDKKQHQFVVFTIFQLDCMTNNTDQYEKNYYEVSLNSIRMFTQSVYIPKKLKQKYLRRLLRSNILTREGQITLNDFKDLIQMSQNQQQRSLYLKHVISIHGQKGKNMVYLLANTNKVIQHQLSRENL